MSDDKVLVSRDLLIDIAHGLRITQERGLNELRTLLAQPSDGALTNEGAEPAAYECLKDDAVFLSYEKLGSTREPLYRHPPKTCTCPSGDGSLRWPCPVHPPEVKVVLPVHKDQDLRSPVYGYAKGWNACLDRVKELNS
jgi:hypothetical protein